jgi:hypothetical protein
MTIPSTTRKAGPLLGTGAQTAWPFTFKVFAESDILVTTADSLGIETVRVLDTDYTVTLNVNQDTSPGGTVTYPISGSALATGDVLTITGNLAYDQPLDLPSGGNFSPVALENELDRMAMQIQQLKEQLGRTIRVGATSGADSLLPAPASNNIIGWDSTAEALQNFPLSELVTAVSFATYRYDTFTGDGTTTNFTLDADPVTLGNIDVSVDGLTSVPGVDHTILNTNLIFTVAPSLGAEILARYGQGLGSGMSGDAMDISYQPAGTGAVPTNVQTVLRETVSVKRFGAVGDGSDEFTKILAAWTYCLANGKDLYFPAGTYSSGTNNMPFKHPSYPASDLLDCGNITIYGDGPNTILRSDSAVGADVLNLYSVKNLHIRNMKITANLSGTTGAGSNGVSIVGGFDNITLDYIWCENLPYVDKALYLDGGKAFTIQPGTPSTECGTVQGRNLFAKGCVHGVGLEVDLVNWGSKKHAIDMDLVAEDCYIGVLFSAGEASGALSAGMTMGYQVRGRLINCQRNVVIGRAHGVDIEANLITTKTAAARRLNPSAGTWNSIDSIVDGLLATYAKDSRLVVYGDIGGCDYKAQIGGAGAGSSGQGAYSENCQIYIDLGGSSGTTDINAVNSGGDYIKNSTIYVSTTTAASVPAILYGLTYNNTITVGPTSRMPSLTLNGPLNFSYTDGVTVYTKLDRESGGFGLFAQQLGASSASVAILGARDHTGAKQFFVRNDGCFATQGRATATAVATVKQVMPIYDGANALVGYVPIYTTYTP